MRRAVAVLAILVALPAVFSLGQFNAGVVPDENAAIAIALAAWVPLYGRDQVEKQKPFRASLHRGVWTVQGTLPSDSARGVAIAEIDKRNGNVIWVSHGK
ncbi:hypothetical protein BWI17_03890 [Betaproteobacteria bacterium GR16-43]|nr:hypothetical protein BWI17_03890 [Betaproteobacteria bacterium GR16-43]